MRKQTLSPIVVAVLWAAPMVFAQTPPDTPNTAGADMSSTLSAGEAISPSVFPTPPRKRDTHAPVDAADIIWANILGSYISKPDRGAALFDYAALKARPSDTALLKSYIETLAAMTPSTMTRNEAIAYWANLYNALTVQVVAENYPVKSIRDIKSGWRKGPWKRDLVTVEGRHLSLDEIEHGIMRPTFKTPLVHYMLNCASIGCPNLKATPWHAASLQADLDVAARQYINSPRGVSVDKEQVTASSIYKWFRKDFGGSQSDVMAHWRLYADDDLLKALANLRRIDSYTYDWDLNAP